MKRDLYEKRALAAHKEAYAIAGKHTFRSDSQVVRRRNTGLWTLGPKANPQ